jgi:hypothetical protein
MEDCNEKSFDYWRSNGYCSSRKGLSRN